MKVKTVIITSVAAATVGVAADISHRSSSYQKSFIGRSFQRREGFEE